jgi:hypothetical protein
MYKGTPAHDLLAPMYLQQRYFAYPIAFVDVEPRGLDIDKGEWQIDDERMWRD